MDYANTPEGHALMERDTARVGRGLIGVRDGDEVITAEHTRISLESIVPAREKRRYTPRRPRDMADAD